MGVGKAYSHPHLLLISCAPSERMEAVRKRGESSKAFRALRQSLPHAIPAPFTLLLTQTHWVFSSCQTSASSVLSSYIHHMAYHTQPLCSLLTSTQFTAKRQTLMPTECISPPKCWCHKAWPINCLHCAGLAYKWRSQMAGNATKHFIFLSETKKASIWNKYK